MLDLFNRKQRATDKVTIEDLNTYIEEDEKEIAQLKNRLDFSSRVILTQERIIKDNYKELAEAEKRAENK